MKWSCSVICWSDPAFQVVGACEIHLALTVQTALWPCDAQAFQPLTGLNSWAKEQVSAGTCPGKHGALGVPFYSFHFYCCFQFMVRKGEGGLMFSGRLGKVGPFLKVECLQLVISSSLHLKTNPQLLSLSECIFANDRVAQDPCFTFLLSVTPIRVLGCGFSFHFVTALLKSKCPSISSLLILYMFPAKRGGSFVF